MPAAKEHASFFGAKAGEKAEKAWSKYRGKEDIAYEKRKAKEAKAKVELHGERVEHAADKQCGQISAAGAHHGGHQPVMGNAPLPPGNHCTAYRPEVHLFGISISSLCSFYSFAFCFWLGKIMFPAPLGLFKVLQSF